MKRLLIAGLLAYALPAAAAQQFSPTASEMALLPPYCADRITNGVSASSPWVAKLGWANWLHIHHYCFALNFANRATRAREQKDKNFALQTSANNFGYVIKATQAQFWLRPQMYLGLAKVNIQQKKIADATRWLTEAINFDSKFEPAYLALIDLDRQTGQGKAALELATNGLRYLPDSKALKTAYRELGGKEPYPEPIAKTPPPEPVPAPASPEVAAGGSSDASAGAGEEGAAPTEAAKAGSSIPAGCRFCPPEETQTRWRESFPKTPN